MKRIAFIFLSIFFAGFASAQSHSFELWTGLGASVDVSKRFSLDFEAEARFQQNSALLKQGNAELGARYSITKPVYVGMSYKFTEKYRKNGYFPMHTVAAVVGYKKKIDDFRFSIQTKLNVTKNMYVKNGEGLQPEIVDKNKVKVAYSLSKHIRPSLFVETYHPIEAGSRYHIATVKYGVNCGFEFKKKLGLDLGYIFRQEIDDCQTLSILTISLSKEL